MDDRPPLMTRFFGASAVLILGGLPLMVVLAYGTLHIWSAAASDLVAVNSSALTLAAASSAW